MATQTTNLSLTKPGITDKIRIAQINGNMDILDNAIGPVGNTSLQSQMTSAQSSISAVQDGLAIISNNNAHPAIAQGQFVYVKNHGSLAEGLYVATTAIAANGTLSASNLTADSSGGLNTLSATLSEQIASKEFSPSNGDSLLTWIVGNINNRNSLPFSFVKVSNATMADTPAFNVPGTEFTGVVYGNSRRLTVELSRYANTTYQRWVRHIFNNAWYGDWEQLATKSGTANVIVLSEAITFTNNATEAFGFSTYKDCYLLAVYTNGGATSVLGDDHVTTWNFNKSTGVLTITKTSAGAWNGSKGDVVFIRPNS